MKSNAPFPTRAAGIISVGGGKGGIGKSTIASGIGCQIGALGKRVIVVDADLAGPNLHLTMGIRYPEKTLNDFLTGKVTKLDDILLDTPHKNVKLVAGATGISDTTDPRPIQKRRLMAAVSRLSADYVIVDIGAGADEDNTDFFSLSPNGLVIITNEPTSIENAYGFLKNGLVRRFASLFEDAPDVKEAVIRFSNPKLGGYRKIGDIVAATMSLYPDAAEKMKQLLKKYRPTLVVNMVRNRTDVQVEESFRRIVREYLCIEMVYVGYVVYDEAVVHSVRQIKPLSSQRDAKSVSCLTAIARNILQIQGAAS
ncbi:MAG: P-loop NTPase [Fibrobacteres bacterium]|nr:P-loop NTPase [Fibrobacterota bacterium]